MAANLKREIGIALFYMGYSAVKTEWSSAIPVDTLGPKIKEWNNVMLRSAITIGTADIQLTGDLTEYNAKVREIVDNFNRWADTDGIESIAISTIQAFVAQRVTGFKVTKAYANLPFPFVTKPMNTDTLVEFVIANLLVDLKMPKPIYYFQDSPPSAAKRARPEPKTEAAAAATDLKVEPKVEPSVQPAAVSITNAPQV